MLISTILSSFSRLKVGSKLPKSSIWFRVRTDVPIQRRLFISCSHSEPTGYTLIDYRDNPPPYQDCYEGEVCAICGTILSKHQTF